MLGRMAGSSDDMPVPKAINRGLQGFKTGMTWGVLFAMFLGIYSMSATTPSTIGALKAIGVFVAFLAVVLFIVSSFTVRDQRRTLKEINDAVSALSRGQLQQANEALTRCCESSNSVLSALARHNLGWTLMRQGRLEEAHAVLSDNDATHERQLKRLLLHGTSSVDLSLYSALLGKIDEAESWFGITERRAAVAANPSLPAMRVFARAVLDCRKERYEDAARLLDERWAECEAALTGSDLRPLRVVRAFALAAAGPRSAGVAESMLASSKPVYEGEYDYLGVAWPAMETFLVSHRLTRKAAA